MIIGELTETYPPMQDGVGRVCWAYCNALEKRGHTAYYIAPEDPAHSHFEGLNTLLYKGIQIPGQNYRFGVPDMSFEFRKEIRQIPFDILHIHSPFLSARVAFEIQKVNPRIPIIVTFHSKYYDDAMKITRSKLISSGVVNVVLSVYDKCDAVWAVNHETAQVLRDYGFRGEIDVAPNGTDVYNIDYDRARETRERLGIPPERKVLLFVGQIDRKKNIPSILQAAALLKREGEDFVLLLAGEGPDRSALEKMTDELDLRDRVGFLGFIRGGEELRALYALSDLFVFPSIYDNAPMVVREAAASGTPAVLVRGSCSAEGVEDGVNGFLCENRPEDIARVIREALPRAREAGIEARRTIPKPWDEIINDVIEKYEKLIARKRAGA
ncbi:MAG: glycosyltransferase [Clostridia bacterium]|nr:glycosyltransferase [Clostridia bacterium]